MDRSNPLRPATHYFALAFGAGFLLGMVRVPFLVPRIGERAAELAEAPIMLAVIVWAARVVVRRHALPPAAGVRLAVGATALALLLGAEVLMVLAQGRGIGEYVASRDPVSGGVYLALLALFAVLPVLVARGRG